MNLLVTTAGNFEGLESQQRIAIWRSQKHIVELMPLRQVVSYIRFATASSLALFDAIVCLADESPINSWMFYRTEMSPLEVAVGFAREIRNLAENCAMQDGRKWRSIPLIIFRHVTDYEFAQIVRGETHANIVFTPDDQPILAMRQIQQIVSDYQDRVLKDYEQLGIMVRIVNGHSQIGPALKKKDQQAENEYYYAPADRRDLNRWVTVKRDDEGPAA